MTTATTITCMSCLIEAKRQKGVEPTDQERNHAMLWGCTCSPESNAEALYFMNLVTR